MKTTIATVLILLATSSSYADSQLIGIGASPASTGAIPLLDIDPSSGAVNNERSTGQSQLVGLASATDGTPYSMTTTQSTARQL